MHVYVAGIGGSGLGPLAQIALDLGHQVSGSDLVDSEAIADLRQKAVSVNIGQTREQIEAIHQKQPIDWYVYSSAMSGASPTPAELVYVEQQGIPATKRDQFLVHVIKEAGFKLLAITGTHGKTTTTAMAAWLLMELGLDVSYSIGGQFHDRPAARASRKSKWFVYEADEYDNNFLAYHPDISLITGLSHDHFDIFPSLKSYNQAFVQFINQSRRVFIWQDDLDKLDSQSLKSEIVALNTVSPEIKLIGKVNQLDAQLAIKAVQAITDQPPEKLYGLINNFPGVKRRFEEIATNLYSDYAHTPEKIAGCLDIAKGQGLPIVVVYQPHSNERQHQIQHQYRQLFKGVKKLYWLASFSAREKGKTILSSEDFIKQLEKPEIAEPAEMDEALVQNIQDHLRNGDLVVAMTAGTLDGWIRQKFAS